MFFAFPLALDLLCGSMGFRFFKLKGSQRKSSEILLILAHCDRLT